MPFAKETVDSLSGVYPLAIATSSYRRYVETELMHVGMLSVFKVIVCADDVQHEKPDPEALLKTCSQLGIAADRVVMVGDSWNDIEAAHRAGMRCIAVPNQYTLTHDFSKADIVTHSLQHVPSALERI